MTQMTMVKWDGSDEQFIHFKALDKLAASASHDNNEYSDDDVKSYLEKNDSDLFFFYIGDEIVGAVAIGVLTLTTDDDGWYLKESVGKRSAHIHEFAIHKQHQGKGYGTMAMKLTLDYIFNQYGVDYAYIGVLHDNVPAVKLYEKVGFKKINSAADKDGYEHDIMVMMRDDYSGIAESKVDIYTFYKNVLK